MLLWAYKEKIKVTFYQIPDIIHCKHHFLGAVNHEPSAGFAEWENPCLLQAGDGVPGSIFAWSAAVNPKSPMKHILASILLASEVLSQYIFI